MIYKTVTVTVIARERAPVRSQHEAHGTQHTCRHVICHVDGRSSCQRACDIEVFNRKIAAGHSLLRLAAGAGYWCWCCSGFLVVLLVLAEALAVQMMRSCCLNH